MLTIPPRDERTRAAPAETKTRQPCTRQGSATRTWSHGELSQLAGAAGSGMCDWQGLRGGEQGLLYREYFGPSWRSRVEADPYARSTRRQCPIAGNERAMRRIRFCCYRCWHLWCHWLPLAHASAIGPLSATAASARRRCNTISRPPPPRPQPQPSWRLMTHFRTARSARRITVIRRHA